MYACVSCLHVNHISYVNTINIHVQVCQRGLIFHGSLVSDHVNGNAVVRAYPIY